MRKSQQIQYSKFSIDLISDLNLTITDTFDWSEKQTSLFCVVAGNISSDLTVLEKTLSHLGDNYRGVLFIDGSLEHENIQDYHLRTEQIKTICKNINNVIYLHNHVVVLNGIAFIGCNGWYGNRKNSNCIEEIEYLEQYRADDLYYLTSSIKKFQNNPEIEKIVIISNSIPSDYLAFNSPNVEFPEHLNLTLGLLFDIDCKVSKWLFGTNDISIDVTLADRRYVNNPVMSGLIYHPKRIEL